MESVTRYWFFLSGYDLKRQRQQRIGSQGRRLLGGLLKHGQQLGIAVIDCEGNAKAILEYGEILV